MLKIGTAGADARIVLLVAVFLNIAACSDSSSNRPDKSIQFTAPAASELASSSGVEVELLVPDGTQQGDIQLRLDGMTISTSNFTFNGTSVSGMLSDIASGSHQLEAELSNASNVPVAATSFESIALAHTDGCEILNDVECMLPYPSSQYLKADDTTGTGWRVAFPAQGMPVSNGTALLPDPYSVLDGFSPGVQILMHFPDDIDLSESNAAHLRAEVRAIDERSLEGDSPTLLIDADTGEQILHFMELDARTTHDSGRQILFLRPGRTLSPGHRYIVAVRNLLQPDGSAVNAESVFAALRDNRPSSITAVEDKRSSMESIFDQLESTGVERSELILAFDFIVGSDDRLTRDILSMRDQSFLWLQDKEASGQQSFTVDAMIEYSCEDGGTFRDIQGTFKVPLFLDSDPVLANREVGFIQYGEDGLPTYQDVMAARYTVLIPCASLAGDEVIRPAIYTHGSFSDYREVVSVTEIWRQNAEVDPDLEPAAYVQGSTDGFGVSALDFEGGGESFLIGGVFMHLDNAKAISDRQSQGIVNVLSLARMMKHGMFNLDPAFALPNGEPALPGQEEEMYSWGISMGGYYGMVLGAFYSDVERINAAVPASHFSWQFQRDVGFDAFTSFLELVFGADTMIHALVISLNSELWSLSDPVSFAGHVTHDPLPGSVPKKILMAASLDDGWSPNLYSEVMARSIGVPGLVGSALPELTEIGSVEGPLSSAYIVYGTGIDPKNPEHAPFLVPLANLSAGERICEPHGLILTPAYFRQLVNFLRPNGEIVNTCNGQCDAQDPLETPLGKGGCDPLAP